MACAVRCEPVGTHSGVGLAGPLPRPRSRRSRTACVLHMTRPRARWGRCCGAVARHGAEGEVAWGRCVLGEVWPPGGGPVFGPAAATLRGRLGPAAAAAAAAPEVEACGAGCGTVVWAVAWGAAAVRLCVELPLTEPGPCRAGALCRGGGQLGRGVAEAAARGRGVTAAAAALDDASISGGAAAPACRQGGPHAATPVVSRALRLCCTMYRQRLA
ncbi:MAG: hypothetical protein WDW36_010114 [Sanguina aurantia]